MKTIRFFLTTICFIMLFTACDKPERAKVPTTIADTVWANYTVESDTYEVLSFSAEECTLKVLPAEEYRKEPDKSIDGVAYVQKWRYTYEKPNVNFTPVNTEGDELSGMVQGGMSAKLTIELFHEDGSLWNAFWSM